MRPNPTRRIAVLELPDVMRSSFALSLDVLHAANRAAEGLQAAGRTHRGAQTRSLRPPFEVLTVSPRARLPSRLAALVVPGLGCASESELVSTMATPAARWAVEKVRAAHRRGTYIATSCAGVFVAAEAGVLDGQRATTSWFLESALRSRYPAIEVNAQCILVESGGCLTGAAALAHADVMLAVAERFAGPEVADLTARYLLLDRRRSQRSYMMLTAVLQNDPHLLRAETFVRRHVAAPISIDDVARAAGLGARTLARRLQRTCGLTPIRFVQRIRLDVARGFLADGYSYDAAAHEVGYSDASALRRVFRKHG